MAQANNYVGVLERINNVGMMELLLKRINPNGRPSEETVARLASQILTMHGLENISLENVKEERTRAFSRDAGSVKAEILVPIDQSNDRREKKVTDLFSEEACQDLPNEGLELTASSVRSCLAPASGSSSGLALGGLQHSEQRRTDHATIGLDGY
jgi:hypothetical protein